MEEKRKLKQFSEKLHTAPSLNMVLYFKVIYHWFIFWNFLLFKFKMKCVLDFLKHINVGINFDCLESSTSSDVWVAAVHFSTISVEASTDSALCLDAAQRSSHLTLAGSFLPSWTKVCKPS